MKVVALAGGVGGAKLASGLWEVLEDLTVVVNTADDFELYGLRICPDLDTVMYTLSGIVNPETGWGVANESFNALEMMAVYGEDAWFKLGDRDLATHILRTARLCSGESLTGITADLCRSLGLRCAVLPMCEERVASVIETPDGPLEFQDYFVRRGQSDEVLGVSFMGIEAARPPAAVLAAIGGADLIVLCPSNPIVSIGPILAVPGMREALAAAPATRVAVSPIVGGRALKGPADSMLRSLGHEVSAAGVARLYVGLLDAMVIDAADAPVRASIEDLGMDVLATDAVMRDAADRARLAREVLEFGCGLARR